MIWAHLLSVAPPTKQKSRSSNVVATPRRVPPGRAVRIHRVRAAEFVPEFSERVATGAPALCPPRTAKTAGARQSRLDPRKARREQLLSSNRSTWSSQAPSWRKAGVETSRKMSSAWPTNVAPRQWQLPRARGLDGSSLAKDQQVIPGNRDRRFTLLLVLGAGAPPTESGRRHVQNSAPHPSTGMVQPGGAEQWAPFLRSHRRTAAKGRR